MQSLTGSQSSALKHPRLLELLCSPDSNEETPLKLLGDELIGASWRVPVVCGIPDFVRYAPKTKKSIEIEIPLDAQPDPGILEFSRASASIPESFQEARFKYPLLQSHSKGFLLDVGAGQGNRRTYEDLGYDYISLDISFNSRQASEIEPDVDIVADCHRLPIRSSCIEAVNCTAVFEHLYSPPLAVREICRVLKPGGLLVGSCSFLEGEHFESQQHYSALGLFRLLEYGGLKVTRLFPGQSLWESHAGNIYFGLPGHQFLGRLHRWLYLSLVNRLGGETAAQRLFRLSAILNFAAVK